MISDIFAPEGDALAPGLTAADPLSCDEDEVFVSAPEAMTTGRAAISGGEMTRSGRGVAVLMRKGKRL